MKKRLFRLIGALLVVAVAGTGCIFGTDDTEDTPPPAPEVVSTNPDNGEDMVEIWDSISVVFSIPMDTASVRAAVSLDSPSRANVPVEIGWLGNMATFEPYDDLDHNTLYTLTIGTGATSATSAAGAALESAFALSFTTEPNWPMVLSTIPDDGDVDVALNAFVMIEFSRNMDYSSLVAAISIDPVQGFEIDNDDGVVTLTFDSQLDPSTPYTVTIDETAQEAWGGQTLPADYLFSFTTGTDLDEDPPYIVSTYPADGATGVPTALGEILIEFSEPVIDDSVEPTEMDPRLLMAVMMVGGPDSEPDIYWVGNTMHIPLLDLPAGSDFDVDFGSFYDLAGNESADPDPWTFSTAGSPEWFPSGAGNWWVYQRYGNDREVWEDWYLSRIENIVGSDFDMSRYRPQYDPRGRDDITDEFTELDEIWHFTRTTGAIKLNGMSFEEDGGWESQTFSPIIDWLRLPPTAGLLWDGVVDMTMGGETARVSYSGEVLAIEDVWWEMGEGEGDGPPAGYFHGCAKVAIWHLVEVFIDDSWETMDEGTETIWYCPGVGKVKSHEESTNYDDGPPEDHVSDTNLYLWWVTN
jgi:hypothetical protein